MDFSLIWTISAGTNVDHISGIGCTAISCVKFSWTTLYTIVRKLRVRKICPGLPPVDDAAGAVAAGGPECLSK